jgi:hypothetical protein
MNLPVALIVLGIGSLLVWAGIADPPKGAAGIMGALLRGEKPPGPAHAPATAAGLTSLAPSLGGAAGNIAGGAINAITDGMGGKGGGPAQILAYAKAQIGKPYLWGGAGPDRFDCSGLTMRAYEQVGIKLPHFAESQRHAAHGVNVTHPSPGDIVFFGAPAHHCGIYIGGSQMIAAPHTGDVVKVSPLSGHGVPITFRSWFVASMDVQNTGH